MGHQKHYNVGVWTGNGAGPVTLELRRPPMPEKSPRRKRGHTKKGLIERTPMSALITMLGAVTRLALAMVRLLEVFK